MSQVSLHPQAAQPDANNAAGAADMHGAQNAPQAHGNARPGPPAQAARAVPAPPVDTRSAAELADCRQRLAGILQQGATQNPGHCLFRNAGTTPLLPVPDARATPALRKAQQQVTVLAEKVHAAFCRLNGINLSRLELRCDNKGKLMLPKAVREARDTAIRSLFALSKGVKEYEKHAGVSVASAGLRDTCLSKAAELGTLFNKLRLEGLQNSFQPVLNNPAQRDALRNTSVGAALDELADVQSRQAHRPFHAPANAVQAMRALAVSMHGTPQFLDALVAVNADLSHTLHALALGKEDLSGAQLRNSITQLQRGLEKIRQMMESSLQESSPQDPPRIELTQNPNIITDMLHGLKAVENTLTALPRGALNVAYWNQAEQVLRFPSVAEYTDIINLLPEKSRVALTAADAGMKALRLRMATELSRNTLTMASLDQMEHEALELCASPDMKDTLALMSLLRHMASFDRAPDTEDAALLMRLVVSGQGMPELKARIVVQEAVRICRASAAQQTTQRAHEFGRILRHTSPLREGGLHEGFAMLRQKLERATTLHVRGDMLAAAFIKPLNVDVMTDVSLRNFNPDFVELETSNLHLHKKQALGAGAVNTAYKCTFKAPDGTPHVRIFKPEDVAREGLGKLLVADLGYLNWNNSTMHNIATCIVAQKLGCESSVVRATVGTLEGKVGLFMEEAHGFTAAKLAGAEPLFTYDGAPGLRLSFRELMQHMKNSEVLPILRANLAKELNKLEWLDLLCAQADRHGNNYMLDVNPQTGDVRLQAIDNDASFGYRMTGLGRMDMHNVLEFARLDNIQAARMLTPQVAEDNQLHLAELGSGAASMASMAFGIHQMSLPRFMDRDMYQALHTMDVQAYRSALQGTLPEPAINAAMARLEEARACAETLLQEGRVITDWAHADVQNFYVTEAASNRMADSKSYFARDMVPLLSA